MKIGNYGNFTLPGRMNLYGIVTIIDLKFLIQVFVRIYGKKMGYVQ